MECSQCGYVFQPFEQECPRCLRQQARATGSIGGAAAIPPPSMPAASPSVASPPVGQFQHPIPDTQPPAPVVPPTAKRKMAWLSGLVAVLSIACIYLAGVTLGDLMAKEKHPPPAVPYAYVPSVSSQNSITASTPNRDPISEMRKLEIITFISDIQRMETRRHSLLQARNAQTASRPAQLTDAPDDSPPVPTPPRVATSLDQMRQESANMRQIYEDMKGLNPPPICMNLRIAYAAYWAHITGDYEKLTTALQIEESDPASSKATLDFLYGEDAQSLRADAKSADDALKWVCTVERLPKTFTID